MIDDSNNIISGGLAELLDPDINRYSKMYGAIVMQKYTDSKGKIIRRPDDPEYDYVSEDKVFILMDDGSVTSHSPGVFTYKFKIIKNSLGSIDISFGVTPSIDPLLDRMRAIQILKSKNEG